MLKKGLFFAVLSLVFSINIVSADTVTQIQSPIYTDEIGRAHFLGRGGYSSVRHTQMNGMQADFVNDAVNNFSKKEKEAKSIEVKKDNTANSETNIMDVIKEKSSVPVSSKTKATFSSEQRKMDASAPYGYGVTNIPSGVNNSKTMYTDELGRLHFFGKGNLIKEEPKTK